MRGHHGETTKTIGLALDCLSAAVVHFWRRQPQQQHCTCLAAYFINFVGIVYVWMQGKAVIILYTRRAKATTAADASTRCCQQVATKKVRNDPKVEGVTVADEVFFVFTERFSTAFSTSVYRLNFSTVSFQAKRYLPSPILMSLLLHLTRLSSSFTTSYAHPTVFQLFYNKGIVLHPISVPNVDLKSEAELSRLLRSISF